MKINNPHDLYLAKSREQKKYYNKTAPDYDRWHTEPASARIVDGWNFANLQKFIGSKKIQRSLDLGCGTGRMAHSLLSISGEVYALDYSEEVIKITQKKYPTLKLSCGQVVNLPYPDNFFDLVIINGSLHHFFAVEQTLGEAQRVLKPAGFFALLGEPNSQFLKATNPFFYLWAISRVIAKIKNLLAKNNAGLELIEPEAESYLPAVLKKKIERAGFQVEKFYTYDYLARSENKWWLKKYRNYLELENKYIAPLIKYRGAAIQCFAIKAL